MKKINPNKKNDFKQRADFMKANNNRVEQMTSRVRCIFHDAGLLFVSVVNYSLSAECSASKEQNELHFWKRNAGGNSNA